MSDFGVPRGYVSPYARNAIPVGEVCDIARMNGNRPAIGGYITPAGFYVGTTDPWGAGGHYTKGLERAFEPQIVHATPPAFESPDDR